MAPPPAGELSEPSLATLPKPGEEDLMEPELGPATEPSLAPIQPPPPIEESPDEEKSISDTLIGLMRTLFGSNIPDSHPAPTAEDSEPVKPFPLSFPADQMASFNSFDSMTDEETARQVQEALARMARGEKPFDE